MQGLGPPHMAGPGVMTMSVWWKLTSCESRGWGGNMVAEQRCDGLSTLRLFKPVTGQESMQ